MQASIVDSTFDAQLSRLCRDATYGDRRACEELGRMLPSLTFRRVSRGNRPLGLEVYRFSDLATRPKSYQHQSINVEFPSCVVDVAEHVETVFGDQSGMIWKSRYGVKGPVAHCTLYR